MKSRLAVLVVALAGWAPLLAAGEADLLQVPAGEVDIPVTRHAAAGDTRILWLPSEHGVQPAEQAAARWLAERGHEVWVADLYAGRFLPAVPSSAEALPAEDVHALIRAARADKSRLWLVTAGRGAKPALEGARLWQEGEGRDRPLAGAVLFYPNLYAAQPEPGEDPAYLPIAGRTRLNVHILQGELSPWFWTLDTLRTALGQAGSQVSVRTFPGIRDRFHFREDATPGERELGARLGELVFEALQATPVRSQP